MARWMPICIARAGCEMVNPQMELSGTPTEGAAQDSTEVGRIVPIYEAIGGMSSRMLRRIIYSVLATLRRQIPDPLPKEFSSVRFPSRREALLYAHFPPTDERSEAAEQFSQPRADSADFRGIFLLPVGARLAPHARARSTPGHSPCACAKKNSLCGEAHPAV